MTDGYHEEWTDRLSDYLAGELEQSEHARVEAHLGACVRCREVAAELREVIALARSAERIEPSRDLWPGIAASLEAKDDGDRRRDNDVIELPTALTARNAARAARDSAATARDTGLTGEPAVSTAPPAARARPVGVSATPTRLAVAAAVLVLVSVSVTWMAASARTAPAGDVPAVADAPDDLSAAATGAPEIPEDLAAQLGVLEDVLATARSTLDSATVVVLERNLQTIETAIADSRRALATDPGNAFLAEHLERMYRRKLIYLREAVRVAEWTS